MHEPVCDSIDLTYQPEHRRELVARRHLRSHPGPRRRRCRHRAGLDPALGQGRQGTRPPARRRPGPHDPGLAAGRATRISFGAFVSGREGPAPRAAAHPPGCERSSAITGSCPVSRPGIHTRWGIRSAPRWPRPGSICRVMQALLGHTHVDTTARSAVAAACGRGRSSVAEADHAAAATRAAAAVATPSTHLFRYMFGYIQPTTRSCHLRRVLGVQHQGDLTTWRCHVRAAADPHDAD